MSQAFDTDKHRFGKEVIFNAKAMRFIKPKDPTWEWLVLASHEFRAICQTTFERSELNPMALIPRLDFEFTSSSSFSIEKAPDLTAAPMTHHTAYAAGSFLAFATFFGINDLHLENLKFGKSADGQLCAIPIDIESFSEHLVIPSATYLIPYSELFTETCGFHELFKHLSDCDDGSLFIHEFTRGYLETVHVLVQKENDLWPALMRLVDHLPRTQRVHARMTSEYAYLIDSPEKEWKLSRPLFEAERIQLANGDFPYFFMVPGSEEVYWYSEPDRVSSLGANEFFRHKKPTFNIELTAPNTRRDLVKMGTLQVLRLLSRASRRRNISICSRGLKIDISDAKIGIQWRDLHIVTERY